MTTYEETLDKMNDYANGTLLLREISDSDLSNIIVALDKQIPKEHYHTAVFEMNNQIRVSVCPSCLWLNYTHKDEFPEYCNKCGQKIDWS